MKTQLTVQGNRMEAHLSGYMYVEDASQFREEAIKKMGETVSHLEIYMGELQFIDSAGMGVLISLYKRCAKRGGTVVLHDLRGSVQEVFKLTRLDQIFSVK
ncbi:MAG TPA: STAS domain-containing protein [Synergistaceae bacterium]|nr:STAS domain-containing protein [Synergistaceae bacterium]HPQ38167.1 STAS domain-containing protein [Synergistaceae bacterium]